MRVQSSTKTVVQDVMIDPPRLNSTKQALLEWLRTHFRTDPRVARLGDTSSRTTIVKVVRCVLRHPPKVDDDAVWRKWLSKHFGDNGGVQRLLAQGRTPAESGVFVVGDMHGDVLVLLEVAKLTGVLVTQENPGRLDELIAIHRSFSQDSYTTHSDLLGDTLGLEHLHWAVGSTATIVFLGDIVDNYRYGDTRLSDGSLYKPYQHQLSTTPLSRTGDGQVKIANMAMDGERILVDTLGRLQREARTAGGDLVWVMGNHDIGNVLNTVHCSTYTSLDQCCPDNPLRFKAERTQWVQAALADMGAVALYVHDDLLFCHGGLHTAFMSVLRDYNDGELCTDDGDLSIDKINAAYQAAIRDPHGAEAALLRRGGRENGITWCRPVYTAGASDWNRGEVLRTLDVPVTALVVAHTLVDLPFTRVTDGKMVAGQHVVVEGDRNPDTIYTSAPQMIQAGSVYGVDFAMSRAFNTYTPFNEETACTMGVTRVGRDPRNGAYLQCIARLHTRCIDPTQR